MRSVSELSFEAIGAVGALLLIWAALGLLISLENAANRIYRAPRGRGWPARVGIYWTVLTLGPILLLVVLYAAEYWLGRAEALPVVGPLLRALVRVRLAVRRLPRAHAALQADAEHARALAPRVLGRVRGRGAVRGVEVGVRPVREPGAAVPEALRCDRSRAAVPVLALPRLADHPVRAADRIHAAGDEGPRLRAQREPRRVRDRRPPVAAAGDGGARAARARAASR